MGRDLFGVAFPVEACERGELGTSKFFLILPALLPSPEQPGVGVKPPEDSIASRVNQ